MEIYLPDDPAALEKKLAARILPAQKGVLCPDKLRQHSEAIRLQITGGAGPTSPLIMTGHQPLFYPPGILIKNLLAGALARALGGSAVNLVVDTDEEELVWRYPTAGEIAPNDAAVGRRETVALNAGGTVLGEQAWEAERRAAFSKGVKEAREAADRIFPKARAKTVREYLDLVAGFAETARRPFDAAVCLRESYERKIGISLRTVYVSDLIASDAYRYFLEVIRGDSQEFRAAYNRALDEYRRARKIKNPAQPLPDLNAGELPFWILKDGRRVPLREDDDIAGRAVLPRAVTLTLFARLFLCDLFIHGRGGARYDQITDAILGDFFQCTGAPFTVASATLALQPRDNFPLRSRPMGEIQRDLRDFQFDPARFLPAEHPLRVRRGELIEQRRRPGADLAQIHTEFEEIRARARRELGHFETELLAEQERAALVGRNQEVFLDREYPFFFYELEPLHAAVEPYAALRGSPPAG